MRHLLVIGLLLCLTACAQNRIPPATVTAKISDVKTQNAKLSDLTRRAVEKVDSSIKSASEARAANLGVREALDIGDIPRAREGARVVDQKLEETEKDLKETKRELAEARSVGAQQAEAIEELTDKFKSYSDQAERAKDIQDEVNAYWGLGAFIYGIKRLSWRVIPLFVVFAILSTLLVKFVPGLKISAWLMQKFRSLFTSSKPNSS